MLESTRQYRQVGFTLIEVLVAIILIALLIGILLPALSLARRSSVGVICSANLAQMLLGWQGAMIDSAGRIPNTVYPTSLQRPFAPWAQVLEQSMQSGSSTLKSRAYRLACPEIESLFDRPSYSNPFFGYAVNCRLRPGGSFGDNEGTRWDTIRSPADYPWFTDPAVFRSPPITADYFAASPPRKWGMGFYHPEDKGRVVYADGHTAAVDELALNGKTDSNGVPMWFLDF